MAMFKLPRLKSNLAIVNGQGRPTDFFLRLFNVDTALRLENVVNSQQMLLDAIIAAQAAADAAQASADAALAAAEAAGGARYIDFSASSPSIQASVTMTGITPQTRISIDGQLFGGTLNADSPLNGTVTLSESDGLTPLIVATKNIAANSTGLSPAPGEWTAESASFSFSGIGSYAGEVTYTIAWSRGSGSEYIEFPDINGVLTATPKATT